MKKIILFIVAIVFAAQLTKAQTEKGTQNLGVDVSYANETQNQFNIDPVNSSTTTQSTKYNSFNAGPTYSYFVASKLDVGVALDYFYAHNNYGINSYPTIESQRFYQGEIFVRRYFMCTDKFGFRAGPYFGYEQGTLNETYPPSNVIYNEKAKVNSYFGGINLGLVYYPAKHLGVSATLANLEYTHYKQNSGPLGNDNGNNLDLSFVNDNLGLSVFYVFGR
jgi:hypothetical protein